ncbi:hypothetical protein MASR2M15_11920 [Anaerolineales bacterium]
MPTNSKLVNIPAPSLSLIDANHNMRSIKTLMGRNGLLLGFAKDMWDLSTIRRILWLQKQSQRLDMYEVTCAIVLPNTPFILNSFALTIPGLLSFSLLADPDGEIFEQYNMQDSGFVFIDSQETIRKEWILLPGQAEPAYQSILKVIEKSLQPA